MHSSTGATPLSSTSLLKSSTARLSVLMRHARHSLPTTASGASSARTTTRSIGHSQTRLPDSDADGQLMPPTAGLQNRRSLGRRARPATGSPTPNSAPVEFEGEFAVDVGDAFPVEFPERQTLLGHPPLPAQCSNGLRNPGDPTSRPTHAREDRPAGSATRLVRRWVSSNRPQPSCTACNSRPRYLSASIRVRNDRRMLNSGE